MSRVGRDGSEESIQVLKNLYRKIIVSESDLQIREDKYLLSETQDYKTTHRPLF
jgi:hypothetical protein